MEVVFKDDKLVYYIDDNNLFDRSVHAFILFHNINLDNIPHLNNAKVLYHYIDSENGKRFPVYYEHGNSFIADIMGQYSMLFKLKRYTKDYTLVNLKLLEDGNII